MTTDLLHSKSQGWLQILTLRTVGLLCLVLLVSCGGGGGGGGGGSFTGGGSGTSNPGSGSSGSGAGTSTPLPSALSFEWPDTFVNGRSWQTSRSSTKITGNLDSPHLLSTSPSCGGSSSFSSGVLANVRWINQANGEQGETVLTGGCVTRYLFGIPLTGLSTNFEIFTIPLELGSNQIVLTTYEGSNAIGRDIINIDRDDGVPPAILSVYPQSATTDIPVNAKVMVHFTEAISSQSLVEANLVVTDETDIPVTGTRNYNSEHNTWTFTPAALFNNNHTYTVTVAGSLADLGGGGSLGDDVIFTFTTGSSFDSSPMNVVSSWPGASCDCVPRDSDILVELDKPVDSDSLTEMTIQLRAISGAVVSGTVEYHNSVLEFKPDDFLIEGQTYRASLAAGITDLMGNMLGSDYQWEFTVSSDIPIGAWETLSNLPGILEGASTIWTGTDFYSWGTSITDNQTYGYRYVPDQNEWLAIANTSQDFSNSTVNFPDQRDYPSLTSVGDDIILFGGIDSSDEPAVAGGVYSVSNDTWADLYDGWRDPDSGIIYFGLGLYGHSTVWTGSELIVWGGFFENFYNPFGVTNRGWSYVPGIDNWDMIGSHPLVDSNNAILPDASGAPAARQGHAGVWTGSEMLVWGGNNGEDVAYSDGALYDPVLETWRPLSNADAPRSSMRTVTGVWTGSELIAWNGGFAGRSQTQVGSEPGMQNTHLAIWDSITETWSPSASGWEPRFIYDKGLQGYYAFWDGSRMIVVGAVDSGLAYDPDRIGLQTSHTLAVYFYDPVTDSWQAGQSQAVLLGSDFTVELAGAGQLLISDGERVYAFLY